MDKHSKPIQFCKMHALGNDFVVIDAVHQSISIEQLSITDLADRHSGIGFDQLLVIEPGKQADFYCRIFNADGSEAEQCGNGLRCIARFIKEEGWHSHTELTLETKAGLFPVFMEKNNWVTVWMSKPHILHKLMPLTLADGMAPIHLAVISMGNPHAIIKKDNQHPVSLESDGPRISTHPFFPHGVNVGLMEIITPEHIILRTYERGAGETLACGSNACAAVVAGISNGWLRHKVKVDFPRGNLFIEWQAEKESPVIMTGPAVRTFKGFLDNRN